MGKTPQEGKYFKMLMKDMCLVCCILPSTGKGNGGVVGRAERIKYLLLAFYFFLSHLAVYFTDSISYVAALAYQPKL